MIPLEIEKRVAEFLAAPSDKRKVLVVYGPTACGKTAWSIELAERFGGEVVSCDSRQIYRGLDIGTGKVTESEMRGIPHFCLDLVRPDQDYSAGEFQVVGRAAIDAIDSRGHLPVLCGGTGLYVDTVVRDFSLPGIPPDWDFRHALEALAEEKGNTAVWEKLLAVDPEYAKELHPNNIRYVIRALEVWEKTGQSKRELGTEGEPPYDVLYLTPYDGDRKKLYDRIDRRVLGMFEAGLLDEVRGLLEKYPHDAFGLRTIGYQETVSHLRGDGSLNEAVALVQKHSRNYAKRQLTWFRRYPGMPVEKEAI